MKLIKILALFMIAPNALADAAFSIEEIVDHLNSALPVSFMDANLGSVQLRSAMAEGEKTIVVIHKTLDRRFGPFSDQTAANYRKHAVSQHCSDVTGMRGLGIMWVQRWVNSHSELIGDILYTDEDCL